MGGEYVPYQLRQNKAVDRQLLLDVLQALGRQLDIPQYLYISFGGAFLEDFKALHARFGNRRLISIEKDASAYRRQLFNRPLKCIHCLQMDSADLIVDFRNVCSGVAPNAPVIVWLDYADANGAREQLEEFESLCTKLNDFDIVKITLNANPRSLCEHACGEDGKPLSADQLAELRLERFNERLGDYVSTVAGVQHMTVKKYPELLVQAVKKSAANGMDGRASLMQPLAVCRYSDSQHQMLTITLIVLPKPKRGEFMQQLDYSHLGVIKPSWSYITEIRLPALTAKEKLTIDSYMPAKNFKRLHKKLGEAFAKSSKESEEVLRNYISFYRHYPNFHRVIF